MRVFDLRAIRLGIRRHVCAAACTIIAALIVTLGFTTVAEAQSCPAQTRHRTKCPWTPPGFEVRECGPGFCWDGGPQGTLACKQERDVANARRTDLRDLVCSDGYVGDRDRCTGVLLRCTGSGARPGQPPVRETPPGWGSRIISWIIPYGGMQRLRDGWGSMRAPDASVAERTVGGLSVLGFGAEVILTISGITALGGWLAARIAARRAAARTAAEKAAINAARAMVDFEAQELAKVTGTLAAEGLGAHGAAQLQRTVADSANKMAGHVWNLLGEETARRLNPAEFAGAVFNAMERAGQFPEPLRQMILEQVQGMFARGTRVMVDGVWKIL
jgi:hypothetical protein